MARYRQAHYKTRQAKADDRLLRTSDDGYVFDSKQERARYEYLRLDPEITELEVKPVLEIYICGYLLKKLSFDFGYRKDGYGYYEEFKGHFEQEGKLRLKTLLCVAQRRVVVSRVRRNVYEVIEVELKQTAAGVRVIEVETGKGFQYFKTKKGKKL